MGKVIGIVLLLLAALLLAALHFFFNFLLPHRLIRQKRRIPHGSNLTQTLKKKSRQTFCPLPAFTHFTSRLHAAILLYPLAKRPFFRANGGIQVPGFPFPYYL